MHALTGAFIAYEIPNPFLALPLAFFSHFAVDLLPHWNPDIFHQKKKLGYISQKIFLFIVFDSLVGLIFGSYLAYKALPNIERGVFVLAGAFLAVLPDLAEAPFYFLGIKNKLIGRLIKFQGSHQWKAAFWPGIILQFGYALLLLSLVR